MQIVAAGALDALAAEPLLGGSGGRHRRGVGGGTWAATTPAPAQPAAAAAEPAAPSHDRGLQFVRRFRALLRLLRPWSALTLALLAIGEAVVVAEVGKVAGSFYLIVVDGQPARFAGAMARATALYAASTLLYAASCWVTESLALSWRRRLTRHLHERYCGRQAAFYFLCTPGCGGKGGAMASPEQQEQQTQEQQQQQEADLVDNPDQRIAADAAELCETLSVLTKVATAAPFKLLYYSALTWGLLGWRGLLAVYGFFWVAALAQRLVVAPVACLVFGQERLEGDLRFAHLRLREYAAEVAQYGGAAAERRHLDDTLDAALANQTRLVRWRSLLAGTTRAVDYCGALLNYFVVGAAVFMGYAGAAKAGGDSGQLAQFVSNASFVLLSLIYAFTELLDLSDQMSRLGGLTARVGQLLEVLPGGSAPSSSSKPSDGQAKSGGRGRHDMYAVRLSLDGHELQPSRLASLLHPPRMLSCLGGSVQLEASVHRLGPDLEHEARAICADAPASGQLLACITFQFAAGGLSLAPDSSSATLERASSEMDRMLCAFLRWEAAVRAFLSQHGRWCNAVDPRTGLALHGAGGTRWSEVAAAHALLGYERREAGVCPVVLHPVHGSSAYPVTLFTDAPPALLEQALAAVADLPPPPSGASSLTEGARASSATSNSRGAGAGSSGGDPGALLELQEASVCTLAGGVAVECLTLALHPGQHLLITGPNGCGKSTFVKALCGLHSLASGRVRLSGGSPGSSPMFVPQRPLAAPGAALWQQLCYPGESGSSSSSGVDDSSSSGDGSHEAASLHRQQQQQEQQPARPPDEQLLALLARVGLEYLPARAGGSLDGAADWAGMLSPGELQRLAVARVLLRRPALAVLDEVTSAVSEDASRQLYQQLHAEGITCVSIGQDSEHLRRLHTWHLRLGCEPAPGAWRLHALPASGAST